jgi:phospholipid transport system transporter-binding protein
MPASTDAAASVQHAGEALRFAGVLSRAHVAALWRQLPALDGVRTLDLREVTAVDSAGLAMLSDIAERAGAGQPVSIALREDAPPAGLAELRAAYRLDATLRFAS